MWSGKPVLLYEREMKAIAKKIDGKLFAVTQDIKVGDEVIHLEKGIKKILTTPECVELADGRYVKVLGKISKGAIWVKEDDKIKVKPETRVYLGEPFGWLEKKNYNGSKEGIEKEETIYLVKCQCNTYH